MRIADFKLGVRLGLAFGLMLLLSLLIAGLGMLRIGSLKTNSEQLATTELERQALVQEWLTDVEMNWLRTEALLKTGNGAYAQQLRQQMAAVGEIQSRRMELVKGHRGPGPVPGDAGPIDHGAGGRRGGVGADGYRAPAGVQGL